MKLLSFKKVISFIDNDQIVDIHRKDLILDNKLTLAADNIKQFRMLVCMGNGMPVTTVSGAGHIQQFCGTADGKILVLFKTVMISAHKITPNFRYIEIILYFVAI